MGRLREHPMTEKCLERRSGGEDQTKRCGDSKVRQWESLGRESEGNKGRAWEQGGGGAEIEASGLRGGDNGRAGAEVVPGLVGGQGCGAHPSLG